MSTCERCTFWQAWTTRIARDTEPEVRGDCSVLKAVAHGQLMSLEVADGSRLTPAASPVVTRNDFGCVRFEVRR